MNEDPTTLKDALDTIKELDIESLTDEDLDDVSGGGSFTCSIFKCTIEAEEVATE
ncbi:MAG: hypothetical protein AAF604_16510 [Acidobacteriota bacterium]